MKKLSAIGLIPTKAGLLSFASILSFLFVSQQASATHIAGGQLTYEYLGNNGLDYRLTYTFYRDCFSGVTNATVNFNRSSASAGYNVTTPSGPVVDNGNVVPICTFTTTTCTGGGTPGRAECVYQLNVTLPSRRTDWVFSVSLNARNAALTTISPDNVPMYVYATLNNTIAPYNNSPIFSNKPAAFVYTGQNFCFNNGTVDVDGDSLVYSLITPKRTATLNVNYVVPYTATQPLTSAPPVTFSTTNGDVCMFPTVAGEVTAMAILVQEYRWGQLIGSVERDIQVSVVAGADNLPYIDGINSTNIYTDTIPAGCNYSFVTKSFDADATQCVTMTSNVGGAVPFLNSFTTSGGCPSLTEPTGTFDFSPDGGDVRSQPYAFTVTVQDNFCNISGQQVRSFQLWVIDFTADFTSSAPACVGQPVNFYSIQPPNNYTYLWNFGVDAVATFAQATSANPVGVTYTSPGAKTVQLTLTGPGGCVIDTSNVITINSSPVASFTSTAPVCTGASVNFTNTGSTGAGTTFSWNFGSGASPASSSAENPSGITYSTAGSKTITHIVTNNFGCVTITTATITINQTPVASFSSTAPSCTADSVDFLNTGTTGATYLWNFGSGVIPATSITFSQNNVVYSTAGIKTVTLITTLGSCADTSIQTIDIKQTPAPAFTSNAPQCEGSEVNFSYMGTTGLGWTYNWDFGTGSMPAASSAQNPGSVMYTGYGTKTIALTVSNDICSQTTTGTIAVNQTPVANFTSTAPACTADSVNFLNTGTPQASPQTYTITVQDSIFTPDSVNAVVGDTIKWIWINGSHTTTSDSIPSGATSWNTIIDTLNQLFPYVVTQVGKYYYLSIPDSLAGMAGVINVSAPNVTYSWNFGSGAAPATSTTENPQNVIYSSAGTKTIQLITTLGSCSGTSIQTIDIKQTPAPSFASDAPKCEGLAVTFNYTGTTGLGWTYNWDFGAGATPAVSSAQNPGSVIYMGSGTKTITLTVNNDICSKTITGTIPINQTPVANFTSTAPSCTADSVDFLNTGTIGTTYSWNFGSGAIPATSITFSQNNVVYSTAGIKTVTLITTLGSCTDTSMQTINITETPAPAFTSAPQCQGASVTFNYTGTTGLGWTYNWDFGTGASPATASAQSPGNVIYMTSGTKTITLTSTNDICSKTITGTIIINPLPIADAGKDTVICNNVSVPIGSSPVAGNTYSWFPPSTLSNATIANPVSSPIAPTTIYIVTVTNANACTATDSIVVTMLAPLVSNAGADEEICRYDSVQVGAGLITGQIYVWSPVSGLSSTTLPNPIASPAATTTYTLAVTGPGCGPVMDEVTIIVHPLPIADAGPNDTITVGSSTPLTATGGVQYTWMPATGLSNISIHDPIANPTITTTYYVTVTDVFGCVNTDSVIIYVIQPTFWLPSAFTPNGDGNNDMLYAHGEGINGFELGIYNRWGEIIFFTKDIMTGWDGKRPMGGEELPQGAYIYYVKGTLSTNEVIDASGLVNLIR